MTGQYTRWDLKLVRAEQYVPVEGRVPECVREQENSLCGCLLVGGPTVAHVHCDPDHPLRNINGIKPGMWVVTKSDGTREVWHNNSFQAEFVLVTDEVEPLAIEVERLQRKVALMASYVEHTASCPARLRPLVKGHLCNCGLLELQATPVDAPTPSRVEALELMKNYATHESGCKAFADDRRRCDCGFAEVKAQLDANPRTPQ